MIPHESDSLHSNLHYQCFLFASCSDTFSKQLSHALHVLLLISHARMTLLWSWVRPAFSMLTFVT